MSAMSNLDALAKLAVQAGNDRLDRIITREQHAAVMARIDNELRVMGATWADILEATEQH